MFRLRRTRILSRLKAIQPASTTNPVHQTRIFIVDDHQLFVDALTHCLNACDEFSVVGTATNAAKAREQLPELRPDILLVDLMMPGESGLELIRHVAQNELARHVIACSGTSNHHSVAAAISYGARCFFEKTGSADELVVTLQGVLRGTAPMGELERNALREMVAGGTDVKNFSAQNLEILRHLANNLSPKEISERVGLSLSAVYKAKTRMLEQAKAKNVFSLAAQLGILAEEKGDHRPFAPAAARQQGPVVGVQS